MADGSRTRNDTLGETLAAFFPHDVVPRCPRDGGRLIATVAIYVHVPMAMEVFPGFGKRVKPTANIRETLSDLRRQVVEDWEDDERAELHCERCDYWTGVVDLETS